MAKRFEETTVLEYLDPANQIDAENGILRGVKLLGENSRNGRRYKHEAMRQAVSLYEDRKMYRNHPNRQEAGGERKFEDWLGVYKNVRHIEGKGLFADAHLLKSGKFFEGIIEAAQKFPNAVGFSHVADGDSKLDGDTEIVESIKEVFSVDLVTDPATTAGLFESKRKTKKKTVGEIAESLPEGNLTRRLLIEMADSGFDLGSFDVVDEGPADGDGLTHQLVDSLTQVIDRLLLVLAKGKASPPPAEPPPSNPADDEDEEMEKKKVAELESKLAHMEAKALLLESGIEATESRVKALATAEPDDRKPLLESWPVQEANDRPVYSPPLRESEGDPDIDFKEEGSFASRYR